MNTIHRRLERTLAAFSGVKNAVLFSSCRNALYTLLLSLQLKPGDEVIIQSFICDSLTQAIRKAGGAVVFAEVEPSTLNLHPREIQRKITPQTKAVVFVHTYGNTSNINQVQSLCRKKNIILIEDIAHALGATYRGKPAGSFGDYAIYSFTKQMINVGGGALLSNKDLSLVRRLRDQPKAKANFLDYGKRLFASLYETRAFWLSKLMIDSVRSRQDLKLVNALSPHFTCSTLEAYLALRQLKSLSLLIRKRQRNYEYLARFVKTQQVVKKASSSYNYLSFLFPNSITRDRALQKNFLFLPPWPGAEVSSTLLFVPNNPFFSKKKLRLLVQSYNKVYKHPAAGTIHGK
ncbi:DegT/DnrJ/EryC1/StrS aminotransferase family protein [Candidatus Woesearchaeota archaeon]|nr:DegT/DnrJ/EryC1/StrS aminotransferase family protein [Candidatus Woesearchaeota archaeon]